MRDRQVRGYESAQADETDRDVLDFMATRQPVPPLDPDFARRLGEELRQVVAASPPASARGIDIPGRPIAARLAAACRSILAPDPRDRLAPLRLAGAVAVLTVLLGAGYWVIDSGRLPVVPAHRGAGVEADAVSKAPQTASDAAALLGVDVGVLRSLPGAASPVTGWVLDGGSRPVAARLPKGVCVDWSPAAATLSGEQRPVWQGAWTRTELLSDGRFVGQRATLYWTPCVAPAGTGS